MTTDSDRSAANPLGAWLDAGLGTLIEAALHHALTTDPVSLRRLGRLEGKQVLLRLAMPPLQLVLQPHGEGIGVRGQLDGDADAVVDATLSGLTRLATRHSELAGEGISLSGDTALVSELRDIVRDLNIDWESLLADAIGDLPAHPLAQLLRSGQRWMADSRDSLLQNLDNYLHEELALVPARPQLEQYCQQVDQLRLAVDRQQARIALVEKRRQPEASEPPDR
ncbi:ubiquinone biosynthesis accessory factor UbiJ [Motiliproteus sediminis]|uniref:ubiquinone biosynthesis accessory factor UbiJ n=1 Tax=Motiliproteus sediminis TaxID=1468178 RepID=UPI001AEFDEF3|nr:SCP2 sterol-binding domain-containing protein [Motiliproteus sediminis]